MKKLLYSLISFGVLLFVVDRIGGWGLDKLRNITHSQMYTKMNRIERGVTEDVVIFGTSRANMHYVPSILSDSLQMSVYNAGTTGSNNIFSQYLTLCHVLKKHTPKIVCLELSVQDYCLENVDPFEQLSRFAPFVGTSDKMDAVYKEAGQYWIYQISHLYRYNHGVLGLLGGLVHSIGEANSDNGYIGLPKPEHFPDEIEVQATPKEIDPLKITYLEKFIGDCEERNITICFMVSPAYRKVASDIYDPLKEIAKKHHIPFLDYHSEGLYLDHPEYFKDAGHLWDQGARLYTARFAHDLSELLR